MSDSRNIRSAGLPKPEKLKSRKRIEALFADGKTVKRFPLLLTFGVRTSPEEPVVCAAFSVSKRRFRRAVDRNRVKRLMREVYRKHKEEFIQLAQQTGVSYDLMFTFIGRELPVYSVLDEKISGLLERWKNALLTQSEQRSSEHEHPDSKD